MGVVNLHEIPLYAVECDGCGYHGRTSFAPEQARRLALADDWHRDGETWTCPHCLKAWAVN